MPYKIELRYFHGWDDAGWTEDVNGKTKPLRFQTVSQAEAAIAEFLLNVKTAVTADDMLAGHNREEYRVVKGSH